MLTVVIVVVGSVLAVLQCCVFDTSFCSTSRGKNGELRDLGGVEKADQLKQKVVDEKAGSCHADADEQQKEVKERF